MKLFRGSGDLPDLNIVADGEPVPIFDEVSFGGYLKATIDRDTGVCRCL